MSIHVMQGERELVQDCARWRVLRCVVFRRYRLAARNSRDVPGRCRRSFERDGDGESTGVEASIQVKPSYGLTDSESPR